jgi:hypothetical protein
MSFLQKIEPINIWYSVIGLSGFCGANYLVYKGIKEQKIEYTQIILDSIWGFMTGSVVGFMSPVIVSVGIISIPGYIAGKFKK